MMKATMVKRVSQFTHKPTAAWYAGYIASAAQPATCTNNVVEPEEYDHLRMCIADLHGLLLEDTAKDRFVGPQHRLRYLLKKLTYIGAGMTKVQMRSELHRVLTANRSGIYHLEHDNPDMALHLLKKVSDVSLDDLGA
jgi:hypothetical protein